jgi:hypothetical protein
MEMERQREDEAARAEAAVMAASINTAVADERRMEQEREEVGGV